MHETKWDTFLGLALALKKTFFLFGNGISGRVPYVCKEICKASKPGFHHSLEELEACTRCSPLFSNVTIMQP